MIALREMKQFLLLIGHSKQTGTVSMAGDPAIFILQTQLYAGVRRVMSRIINVEYLNEGREYAHTILSLAEKSGDQALVKLSADLRTLMQLPVPAQVKKASSRNEPILDKPVSEEEKTSPPRPYIGSLR